MKAHKITITIIDTERQGAAEIKRAIEDARFIDPKVFSIETADIGEWSDDHPLNSSLTEADEWERLFPVEDRLRAALEKIRTEEGKVCREYETCEHVACQSSYNSWAIADEVISLTQAPTEGEG